MIIGIRKNLYNGNALAPIRRVHKSKLGNAPFLITGCSRKLPAELWGLIIRIL